MVGFHRAILCNHCGSFHDGQYIALHPSPGNVGPGCAIPYRYFIYFVKKYYSAFLSPFHRLGSNLIHINELLGLLLKQYFAGIGNGYPSFFLLFGEKTSQHILYVYTHFLYTGTGENLHHGGCVLLHLNLHVLIFQLSPGQFFPQAFPFKFNAAGKLVIIPGKLAFLLFCAAKNKLQGIFQGAFLPGQRRQHLDYSLFGHPPGLFLHLDHSFNLYHSYGGFHQVPYHALYITAHITHFGKLGGLHLNKGGLHQLGQPTGNFCFAHPGGSDHQYILGYNLILKFLGQSGPPIPVSQGNGHGLLGIFLAHDIFIQLFHCLLGSKGFHQKTSLLGSEK